jgi:uncharacterized protein (DUF952 family)/RimJ/RimL family protein N-acetyltransferase
VNMFRDMELLRPVQGADAEPLFPLIHRTPVTDTILWDGPDSLDEYRHNLAERESQTARGEAHVFTIIGVPSGNPTGSASIRPDAGYFRGDLGLWIGELYQGKGYGTRVVRRLVAYGFEQLDLMKIDAYVFTGNHPSQRIFEKNGFLLEGTIRSAVRKRGHAVDEWLFGITRQDYERRAALILHLCKHQEWEAAQAIGEYRTASLEEEGFIHCSRPEQILDVANHFYPGREDLVFLKISIMRVEPEILWEPSDGEEFPHVYGPINLDAVGAVVPFTPDADGKFRKFPAV